MVISQTWRCQAEKTPLIWPAIVCPSSEMM